LRRDAGIVDHVLGGCSEEAPTVVIGPVVWRPGDDGEQFWYFVVASARPDFVVHDMADERDMAVWVRGDLALPRDAPHPREHRNRAPAAPGRTDTMTKRSDRRFRCIDCATDTLASGEYYMVRDDLWAAAGMAPHGGMLCSPCLEHRIGRWLVDADF